MGWKRGQSGNPTGRKRGTGEIGKLRAAVAEHIPSIIQSLLTAAQNGDVQAARVLLDRVFPSLRPTEQAVDMDIDATASLSQQARAVMAAAATGQLAPGQAASLVSALGVVARVDETTELADRVAALEQRIAGGQK